MPKQLRLGVIGWLYHYDDEHARTVAACDINTDKLDAFHGKHPGAETYTDYRTMVDEADLDAVIISTPNWLHREMAEHCLRSGLDVFLEKPMGVNREEIDSLLRVQCETGRTCAVDFEMRVSTAMNRVREIIAAGEIGRLNGAELVHHRGGWVAEGKEAWRTDSSRSGGTFFMEVCHDVDIFRCILGEITHVQSFSHPNVLPQYRGMPDNVCTHLWFAGGQMATILTSHTSSVYEVQPGQYDDLGHDMYWIFVGDEGAIRLEQIRQAILVTRFDEYHPDLDRGKRVSLNRLEDYADAEHFNHDIAANHRAFLRALSLGQSHHQDLADAWRTHVVCLEAERSAMESFQRIEVDYTLS